MRLLLQLAELEAPELQELPCEPDPWAGAEGGGGLGVGDGVRSGLRGAANWLLFTTQPRRQVSKRSPLTAGDTMGTTAFYRGLSRPGPVISVFISRLSV